jgi:DNA end-binding protein Ku
MQVVAIIHREKGVYGVSFPDFPGCTTVADDLDDAVANAGEVLASHAERLAEEGLLPRPRSLSELQSDRNFSEKAKNALLFLVPYEPPSRAVRVNITLQESLLARVDRAAEAVSETRSAYLATAARLRMRTVADRPRKLTQFSSKQNVADAIEPDDLGTWKGYLKLSLVSCPISLHAASSSVERVSFVQVNRKTGNPLDYQLIDSETGEAVMPPDIARGYDIGEGRPALVEDYELAALHISSKYTIEIDAFVPRAQIDERYLVASYYVAPDGEVGHEAFAVIRECMRPKKMVAIGRVMLTNRERPIALEPLGKGLRAMTLRHLNEVRDEAEYFANLPDVHVPREMLALAEHIVDTKTTDFDPSRFKDHYESAVVEMLKRKKVGVPIKSASPARSQSNVINLMDALRRSLETERKRSVRR